MTTTRAANPTATRPANRLASETSPYLLQHAHNPVDWRPWGQEAIDEARRSGKPLFVSIGYATCYWCHVMERESFEDETTAALLNRLFVPVKIDREQRPDIDEVYMTACQVYTRSTEGRASGGWPLSVFVDPASLKPFYVGTYYPPEPAFGRPSFRQLLEAIGGAWRDRHDEVLAQAARLGEAVAAEFEAAPPVETLDASIARSGAEALLRFADPTNGGFGGAPKFPQPAYLELLATQWNDERVAAVIERALDRMACGGIFDQLAGGFHRYAVDAMWLVPHFEKMLYDNAQLASLYARSYARSGDPFHAEIARRTADYVLRSMGDADGAFYSAQDAEVDAREGGSYVWTAAEVQAALAKAGRGDLADFALHLYGLDRGTNFQDPHHPEEPPRNVLFLAERPERLAQEAGLDRAAFDARRAEVNTILLAERDRRQQPITDDKVLASWNGLMITALAEVGTALHEERYVRAAEKAMAAIERRMAAPEGGWMRASRAGKATVPAFLEDLAALAKARIALYRATSKGEHLAAAEAIVDVALVRFADPRGGWFDTQEGQSELFVRVRNLTDGAVPSGNGLLLLDLVDLVSLTGKDHYRTALTAAFAGLSGAIAESPVQAALSAVAVARAAREAPDTLPRGKGTAPLDATVQASLDGEPTADGAAGTLTLVIQEGWHVYAHDPGPAKPGEADLVGMLVSAAGGTATLEVDYPAGTPWRDGARVHIGTVRIPFRLHGSATHLLVRVQPCDERACQLPRELRVPVRIQGR